MTDTATYSFFSVLRRGLAALIAPGEAATDVRVDVPLSLSVGGSAPTGMPALALRGPGDIIGFDATAVRRMWPAAGADAAEPNYFPLVEFSDADLPWRYTPDATGGDRLAPWICLIVAEAGEIGSLVPAGRDRSLGTVTLNNAPLPDLSQSWAWAHAQVLGAPDAPATDFNSQAIAAICQQHPERLSARLLCPRQLNPLTSYQAFVVPAFERGRVAGLGDSPSGVARLAAAWQVGQNSVTLPFYFSWSFRTGEAGDFASLAAKLTPVGDVPEAVWKRQIAISPPGADPPNWQVVGLTVALVPQNTDLGAWKDIDTHGFTTALAARTNADGNRLEPPLYGRWLAAKSSLSTDPSATPPWFHQLNADPRSRVASGLGTTIVQTEQQQLLAGAWAQVEGIRAANNRLRLAQLARELALRVYTRHFVALAGDVFLQVSAPLHRRVRAGASTVAAQLGASPIVAGALAPAWRRTARPFGSLGIRQGRPARPPVLPSDGAVARMNSGELSIVPALGSAATDATSKRMGDLGAVFKKVNLTPDRLQTVTLPDHFVLKDVTTHAATAVQSFSRAAVALMKQLADAPAAGPVLISANLDATRGTIASALHPINTIETPLAKRLAHPPAGPRRTDPIEPVMAAPDFPQAMYQPLAELGREWLLPGLDQFPQGVALFVTNWTFVESFLVGLNHEMARKLLWNGYPTDQRGTYFRYFWDIGSRTDGSSTADIGPIHAWTAPLGKNRTHITDPLVLLVRGELIRRYPNVIVYATPAEPDGSGGRQPSANEALERHPIFFGQVQPDVALFGFDLDPTEVRGNPGWFFVLQEHPSEPRFGLAAAGTAFGAQPASWQALGWDHLAASAQELASLNYINLAATLPKTPPPDPNDHSGSVWHSNGSPPSRSADLAHITLRHPKRFAVHGSILLPKQGAHS
jgi:hypothetical protein